MFTSWIRRRASSIDEATSVAGAGVGDAGKRAFSSDLFSGRCGGAGDAVFVGVGCGAVVFVAAGVGVGGVVRGAVVGAGVGVGIGVAAGAGSVSAAVPAPASFLGNKRDKMLIESSALSSSRTVAG
jgi:hypothetical protein